MIETVRPGDTVGSVAARLNVPEDLLAELNGITVNTPLVVGQALVALTPEVLYTVLPGDTLYSIARAFSTSVVQLYRNNPGLGGNPQVEVNRTLVIRYREEPSRSLAVNAYAYPSIAGSLLDETLPYLTYFTPFTYGFTLSGELVPPPDEGMVARALRYGVTPWMHLSTLTEQGNFSSALGLALLRDSAAQATLTANILRTMEEKNYQGLDVDFEFLGAEGAAPYAEFIADLRRQLAPLGYEVVVALAPKVRADQPGTLYEGHDYAALGAAADGVLLMTYEWGYTYGPPMAVAPIPSVRRVLDYAVTVIPQEKIFMGVPTYGYDWPLPYTPGTTMARSLSNPEAVALALTYGAEIQFDPTAEAPYFVYTAAGVAHKVWFEDARSIAAKLELVGEYGFRGIGYWNLDRPFPQNWSLLNSRYRVENKGRVP